MNKKREAFLEDLLTGWFFMSENSLGTGALGFHGYNGNTVVYKLNCDYMDFYEFHRADLIAMLKPYDFEMWQTEEYLNVQDVS